jgi:hypothetical protein
MPEHKKYITAKEAIVLHRKSGYGNISKVSIYGWAKKYGLGIKIAGRWKIDQEKFENFLRGELNEET